LRSHDNKSSCCLDGGALFGERCRIIISTDIGGSDEDDIQSMVYYLVYSDLFDTEGIISSPPKQGRVRNIFEVIDIYSQDYPCLQTYSNDYPRPDFLRSITRQGAVDPAPVEGYGHSTEGSQWIIQCAKKDDSRPLYILVWGAITDVAQALYDEPSIKEKIRLYFIASWNRIQDINAFRYIDFYHPDSWLIENEFTFRGWYMGGNQSDDLGNEVFVRRHIYGHGALGNYFAPLKAGRIKMSDASTVAYLLCGKSDDPTAPHWGGSFVRKDGRNHWWIDNANPTLIEGNKLGAKTVNQWREMYLRDFQHRMDRCLTYTPK
jgi:hypothetical protein